jgi:hypothetical protein
MYRYKAFSFALLCSFPITRTSPEPIMFESKMLKYLDGTALFDGRTVSIIQRYREQLHRFMHAPHAIGDTSHSLVEWARLEHATPLFDDITDEHFVLLLKEFGSFSEPFIDTLRSAKPVLLELIKEFCAKRNRHDSILLILAEGTTGHERTLFKHEITSYNKLCDFCIDLIHFFKDLLHSCPKACEEYKHYNAIRKQVNLLLSEHKMTLKRESFRALMSEIHKQYQPHEEVTRAKTEALFKAYMAKHTP